MIAGFQSPLDVRDLTRASERGIWFMLLAPLVYDSHRLGMTIIVPCAFVTNFASVPRVLWSLVPPIGRHSAAAALHDWIYQRGGMPRGEADRVMLEAMETDRVSTVIQNLIFRGLQIGGLATWRRYRQMADVEEQATHG